MKHFPFGATRKIEEGVRPVDESDRLALRYLLGDLSTGEREAFEDRYFADDSLHEQLLALEEELIDAYLRGELSREQRRRVQEFFLRSPERMEKLQLARALSRYAERQERRAPAIPVRLRFALAGVALAALLSALLLWQAGRRKNVARIPAPPQPAAVDSTPSPAPVPNPPPRPVLSFLLAPVERASGGEANIIRIPAGLHTIRLQVNLDRDQYPSYRVTIRGVDSNRVIEQGDLHANTIGEVQRAVFASFPSESLPVGDYILRLEGAARPTPSGQRGARMSEGELVGEYGFRISNVQ